MTETLERLFNKAMAANGPRADWSPDIAAITKGSLGELGFDRKGNLYFGGNKLQVARKFALTFWQQVFAGATATGVFLAGLGAFIEAVN